MRTDAELAQLREKNAQLRELIDRVSDDALGQKAENNDLREREAELRDLIEHLEADIAGMREECEAKGALISGMDGRLAELDAQNARLREALTKCMVGGNSLGVIIGADHPPRTASHDEAMAHYGYGPIYEAWCCWRALMEARDMIPDPR